VARNCFFLSYGTAFLLKFFGVRTLEKFKKNIINFIRVYTLKPKKFKNFLISLSKNGKISPGKSKDQSFCFHFLVGLINCMHPNFKEGISIKWQQISRASPKSENIAKRNSSNSNPSQNIPQKKEFLKNWIFFPQERGICDKFLIFFFACVQKLRTPKKKGYSEPFQKIHLVITLTRDFFPNFAI
jgi:hypothetical protein